MSIVWLDEQACADGRLTGGKAAGLSRLGTICRIPPGFCLTTAAFEQALAAGLIPELSAPEPAGAVAFRESALYRTVLAAYQALSQRMGQAAAATAVRSSGVDEDGADASFAGQHETYLNIDGDRCDQRRRRPLLDLRDRAARAVRIVAGTGCRSSVPAWPCWCSI